MKVLFIDNWIHPKNKRALELYKNIQFYMVSLQNIGGIDLSMYDGVYSSSEPVDVAKYPGIKWVFGPHFSVFPDQKLLPIRSPNCSYILPSAWTVTLWESSEICRGVRLENVPFAVEVDKFCETAPIYGRDKVFVYYKSRDPAELRFLETVLAANGINYKLFHYEHKYDEKEYLACLQEAKFGIWLGRHESQGFALEEALSCNVPLLVWNVSSLNQEYGQRYPDMYATVIPYWDERCGEYFYNRDDLVETLQRFLSKLYTYRPREYVLENLSPEVCEERFMKLFAKTGMAAAAQKNWSLNR